MVLSLVELQHLFWERMEATLEPLKMEILEGSYLVLKKVSENGFIVLKDNQEGQAFAFSVGLGGGLPPGERIDLGMVLEGRTLYSVSWRVKEGAEDYSKPTKQVAFVNPNYGPKKIEKKQNKTWRNKVIQWQNQLKTVVRRHSQSKNYLGAFQYLDWLLELDLSLF